LLVSKERKIMASFLSTRLKKKSRGGGFFFLVLFTILSSLFTLHSSLFTFLQPLPARLFQRRDKREERKENVSFRYGEEQF